MLKKYKVYFEDILESIAKIEEYTQNMSSDKFVKNTLEQMQLLEIFW